MPSRLRPLPRRHLLALAIALAASGASVHAQTTTATSPSAAPGDAAPVAHTETAASSVATPATAESRPYACPLGAFRCPPKPVSYALCRPNALLEFYEPGLPTDAIGREQATTDVDAALVDSSNTSVYHLEGRVRLQRYDQLLRADSLDYNDGTTAYDAKGDVRYQDSTLLLAADHIQGTTQPDHASADHVRYQLLSSRGNGVANRAELIDPQREHLQAATYSTCDPGHRVWEFRAKDIAIDKESGVGKAHSATMRLHDVPFLYVPYLTFPTDDRRKSGFLFPTFANSGNSGFMVAVPYYLNLAPNYDATLTPHLYSERGVLLGTEFRFLTDSSRGVLQVDYLPNDQRANTDHNDKTRDLKNGSDRYFINLSESTRLPGPWTFNARIKDVSDKYYFEDFASDLVTAATTTLSSDAYIKGSGNWWTARVGVKRYQSVDPDLPDSGLQYKRWPQGVLDLDVPISRYLEFGMKNEAVAFRKDNVVEGDRLDVYPYLSMPFEGAAWFVKPEVGYRYTAYRLSDTAGKYGFDERRPTRALPIASIDSGLVFERGANLFGKSYTQTLEPRLYYLYVPYRDQDDLPRFDTREMTFDFWQMFTTNRFSGADRQMDANNLTAAVTSRLLDDGGVERASVSFGQIRYFTPQKVQLSRGRRATDYHGSAYIAQGSLQLSDDWHLNSSYQWDPNDRQTDVGTFGIQRRLGADGIINFSYRYRRNFLEQYDVSTVYPVSDRWRLLARWSWSHQDLKTLEALAGVEYDSCCVAVRLVGRHYVRDRQGNTNNAIMLEIEFKGLGAFNPQTEDVLRRGILGYQ